MDQVAVAADTPCQVDEFGTPKRSNDPRQLSFAFALWTREMIQEFDPARGTDLAFNASLPPARTLARARNP